MMTAQLEDEKLYPDLVRTDICGDSRFFSACDAEPTPVQPTVKRFERPSPLLRSFVRDLTTAVVRGRINHWRLTRLHEEVSVFTPDKIIGNVIRTRSGKTSPIAFVDPLSRRVQTTSGSVYELGMPEAMFAAKGRLVLRQLGY